jgi:Cof subfamily protein (haloacid dehalogenase superfamily)
LLDRPALLALDLDGTLIDERLEITPRVRAAVRSAMDLGVAATIVTGRMFVATTPFAEELGIDGDVVCYQGAAVYHVASRSLLREIPLAHDVAMRLVHRAREDGLHVQLYRDDHFYVEEDNRYARLYARLAGVEPIVVPSLERAFAGYDSTKCNIVTDPDVAARYIETVRCLCGEEGYVTRSNPEFIEVMNPRVDKGEALRFVAARAGVPMERVLAIGDSYNDVPLLTAAGIGIAMGSSPDELKAVADAVVGDYAHDGVAEALERFVLAAPATGSLAP